MKNKIKSLIALVLTLALITSVACIIPIQAAAADSDVYVTHTALYRSTFNDPAGLVKYKYSDDLFSDDSTNLSAEKLGYLSKASIALAAASYHGNYITTALEKMGYNIICQENYSKDGMKTTATEDDNDIIGYTIAKKNCYPLFSNEKTYSIYAIIVRGTNTYEWISNFKVGRNNTHDGFTIAMEKLYSSLDKNLKGIDRTKDKIWITGHSRGAAVTNLLGQKLSQTQKYALKKNIFAFAYACPNTVISKSGSYPNVYNYVNDCDFVCSVPLYNWGYDRYGTTISIDEDDALFSKVKSEFEVTTTYSEGTESKPTVYKGLTAEALDSIVSKMNALAPSVDAYYSEYTYSGNKTNSPYKVFDTLAHVMAKTVSFDTIKAISIVADTDDPASDCIIEILKNVNGIKHCHAPEFYIAWMNVLYASSDNTAKTSTDFRIYKTDSQFKQSPAYTDYPEFANMYIENSSNAKLCVPVAGIESTNIAGVSCETMVPQGICFARDYMLVSAYDSLGNSNSVIYVYSDSTRKYLTTIILPVKSHVGGIAYDYDVEGNIWICNSTNGMISLKYAVIDDAVKLNKPYVELENANINTAALSGVKTASSAAQSETTEFSASYCCYDSEESTLWVGEFVPISKAQVEAGITSDTANMYGFKINSKTTSLPWLENVNRIQVPDRTQGATIRTYNNKKYLVTSRSYVRKPTAVNYISQIRVYAPSWDSPTDNGFIYKNDALKKIDMPPMVEGIYMSGNYLYTLFESSASCYFANVDGKGVCTAPVDRITAFKLSQLLNCDTHSVKYIADGKTVRTAQGKYGTAISNIPSVPQKTGCIGTWDNNYKTFQDSDCTVTAVYSPITYTINYYDSTGKVRFDSQTVEYGQSVELLSAESLEVVHSGYKFNGWSLSPKSSEVKYSDCQTVSNLATEDGAEVSLYASVEALDYNIKYYVDGKEYKTETYKFGDKITPLAAPEKEGYTFSGWSEIPETMPANDVTVNGTFAINSYKITYNVDGEEYKTETYKFGDKITPLAAPEKEGYTFSGWSEIPETMPANDVTVNGTFAISSYKITYNVDGEKYKTETYKFGDKITPLAAPEKEGYTFSGWSEIPETMPANDVTVNGTFTKNEEPEPPKTYATLKVTVSQGTGLKVKIGDGIEKDQPLYYKNTKTEVGQEITLTPTSTIGTFLYWVDENDSIVSYNEQFKFVMTGNRTLMAVYSYKVEEQSTVTFIGAYDQILSQVMYGVDSEIDVPEYTSKTGCDFVGWSLDGANVIADDKLEQEILAQIALGNDVTVKAVYKVKDAVYEITVENGTGSGTYTTSTLLTITASKAPDGKKFAYWTRNGRIVSYSEVYSFLVNQDAKYTAVYVDENEEVKVTALTEIEQVTYDSSTNKMSFIAVSSAPKTLNIIYNGVILTSNASIGENSDAFIKDVSGVVGSGKQLDGDGTAARFTLTKKNVFEGDVWYARSYIIYYDENGKLCTAYGDIIRATVKDSKPVYEYI